MFLLVPAHPGFPGQIPQSRKTVVCVCVFSGNSIAIKVNMGQSFGLMHCPMTLPDPAKDDDLLTPELVPIL